MPDIFSDFEDFSGFRLEETGKTDFPEARTARFRHEISGLALYLMENGEDNLGMSIAYRVPQADNSDAAHVLEHAVTASSEKYRSRDIFFDMEGQTYSTFLNAETFPAVTIYQLASRSQEQLMKMADVYLSCLTRPSVLTEENYFLREGVRRELRAPEDPVTLSGVVFHEDLDYMTDTERVTFGALMEALYPGSTAARGVGCCYREWEKLTWDHVREVFRKYYRFDNALIVLYGHWDWRTMLAFLDREYLGRGPRPGEAVRIPAVPHFPPEKLEITVPVPAFLGDDTDRSGVIVWAADLTGFTDVEKQEIAALCDILNEDGSVFGKKCAENGFLSTADWETDIADGYPADVLSVWLYDTEQGEKEKFVRTVMETLEETEKNGVDPELLRIVLKGLGLDQKLQENQTGNAVDAAESVCCFWASTGRTDVHAVREEALRRLRGDGGKIFQQLAGRLLRAGRTVTAYGAPEEGLAEHLAEERAEVLRREKSRMSREEVRALIRKTREFDCWNQAEVHGSGFTIPAEHLPEPVPAEEVLREDRDGITVFSADGQIRGAAAVSLCFDLSRLTAEELWPLNLALMVFGDLAAGHYSRAEVSNRISEFLNDFYMDLRCPETDAGEFCHPMLCVSWTGTGEDFAASLELALEILGETRWENREELRLAAGKYREDYNHAKSDPLAEAKGLADAQLTVGSGFAYAVDGPDFYRYLLESADTENFGVLIRPILRRVLTRSGLTVILTAGKEDLGKMTETAFRILGKLPPAETVPRPFAPERFLLPRRGVSGIFLDSPLQSLSFRANLRDIPGMRGRYLPLFAAASNRFLIPELRFKNGAYSGGFSFNIPRDLISLYSSSDPAVGDSLRAVKTLPDELRHMEMAESELRGYILQAYGMATPPAGPLTRAAAAIWRKIGGADGEKIGRMTRDIRRASLADREAAADALAAALDAGTFVIAGNAERMGRERELFDEIRDYRNVRKH